MRVVVERYEVVVLERLPVGWIARYAMCKGSRIKPGYSETMYRGEECNGRGTGYVGHIR